MDLSPAKTKLARFGLFEADLEQRLLTKRGFRIKLQGQPFQVLALLLERRGEVVTRDEIRQKLWSANTYVEFDAGLNTAIKKLRAALCDSPDNPKFIETIPRRGYRFLAPVTFPPPSGHSGGSEPEPNLPSEVLIATQERSRLVLEKTLPKSIVWVGLALAMVVGTGLGSYFYRARRIQRPEVAAVKAVTSAAITSRPSVAVMGFRNLSPEAQEAWLSTALAEMLSTELSAGQRLRMVPGEEISRAKLDLSLADTEALGKESLARVKANIGADYVVLGAYSTLGEKAKKRIRLDLRLQDTRSGETITEDAVVGNQQELFDLVTDVGSRLRQTLQAGTLAPEQAVQVRASLPSNIEAARLYAEGIAKLRLFEASAARDLLVRAIAADPSFPMAHAALSSAWSALGYDSRALQEAKLAFDLATQLSPEERLLSEGRYREASREWPRAMEVYRQLSKTFPDNLDYGIRLASVQSSAAQGKDALLTLDGLRHLPFGLGEDPRIDLEESRGAEMMGDFRRSQQAAARAAEKGRALGAQLIVAQARSDEGWDWDRLGEFGKAADALAEARTLFAAAKDYRSTALAINMMGDFQYDKGEYESAVRTLNESLALCRAHGFEKCADRSLNALGHIQYDQGDLQKALSTYEEVLRINRNTGVKAGVGIALSNIGNVLQDLGDLPQARTKQEESLKVFTDIGDKRGMGATLGNLGNLLDDLGDLPGAIRCFERAYKLDEETGYKRGFGFVLAGWGGVLLEQDRLPEARNKLEQALKVRQEMGSPSTVGDSQLSLAKLVLEEGNAAEAEKLARDSATQFANVKEWDDEVSSAAVSTRSLLAQGKLSAAQSLVRQTIHRKVTALPSRFDASLAATMVQAASGTSIDAEKQFESIVARAKKLHFTGYEFDARLELGELQMKMGHTAAGEVELNLLEQDARSKGYLLIARKAAETRRTSTVLAGAQSH